MKIENRGLKLEDEIYRIKQIKIDPQTLLKAAEERRLDDVKDQAMIGTDVNCEGGWEGPPCIIP